MMIVVGDVVGAPERVRTVSVVVINAVDVVAVSDDAAAEGLQGRRQRWRAGGGRCRAPEAPARRTGGGYAAGRYRHTGVEWDSTWRALCHAHRRHHSPLHGALHPLLELPPGFGLESDETLSFLPLCLFFSCCLSLSLFFLLSALLSARVLQYLLLSRSFFLFLLFLAFSRSRNEQV